MVSMAMLSMILAIARRRWGSRLCCRSRCIEIATAEAETRTAVRHLLLFLRLLDIILLLRLLGELEMRAAKLSIVNSGEAWGKVQRTA
jgi:hypothetical protein